MNLLRWLSSKFHRNPKAFVIDESKGLSKAAKAVENLDIDAEPFSNYKTLLYRLNRIKCGKYKYGMIHQNGSHYKPVVLSNFIKQIDPSIKIIIYKNESELKSLVLT